MVEEAFASHQTIQAVFYTEKFADQFTDLPLHTAELAEVTTEETLRKVGALHTNDGALAVVQMPKNQEIPTLLPAFTLALDDVRDPGNLGTILRIADWFGVNQIVCSETTVDIYNAKVIAASMGSIFRIPCYYTALPNFLKRLSADVSAYGAFMEGHDIDTITPNAPTVLVMGNESQGIRPETAELITLPVTIPRYGNAESLNVAIATGILCERITRKLQVSI